jgi:hypothetical protein
VLSAPQQDALSEGAQHVVCSAVEQHAFDWTAPLTWPARTGTCVARGAKSMNCNSRGAPGSSEISGGVVLRHDEASSWLLLLQTPVSGSTSSTLRVNGQSDVVAGGPLRVIAGGQMKVHAA